MHLRHSMTDSGWAAADSVAEAAEHEKKKKPSDTRAV